MSRLPVPGNDEGVWGEVLNDYLLQSLDENGSLRPGVVSAPNLTQSVQASLAKADSSVQTVNGVAADGNGNVAVPAGPTGPQGPEGPEGPQGIQGEQGEQGIAGADGASITVTLVEGADWPPPADPDPLHWYIKVS